MKLGIVLSTKDPETSWNALRLGVEAAGAGHDVKIFLLGPGVEIERIGDGTFNVQKQIQRFASNGGELMACGTCLDLRDQEASAICPVSTMSDLLDLVATSDKVVTFG